MVTRFGKTTRWFHWTFALSFLALAGTGGALSLRGSLGIGAEAGATLLRVHLGAAVALVVLPLVVLLSGQTGETLRDLSLVVRWSRDDLRWLALQPLAALGRAELPPAGKLNAGQKVNALLMAGLTAVLLATGALLWRHPGALVPLAIHVGCFVAWIPLFGGHLFLALVAPGTRPALRGMILGHVPREWARHHHAHWMAERERQALRVAKIEPEVGPVSAVAERG
jgi:formate dehydrogenase subunit gamma